VQPDDVLKQDWKDFDFARDIWGKGERDSFLIVLKEGMAGRAGRGRGRGRGRGKITGERGRTGGTRAIPHILDFLLHTSNHHLVSTPIHPLCSTRINHLCSFRGQGKGQGHQQHLSDPRQRPQNKEGFRPRGVQQRQRQDRQEEPKQEEAKGAEVDR
jgi:hypothetical protein